VLQGWRTCRTDSVGPEPRRRSHPFVTVAATGRLVEANGERGASWNLVTDDDPEELEVECPACGASLAS
jgi:hypothetical protein